jgi:23S rRNA pseudouridine2604 synthase
VILKRIRIMNVRLDMPIGQWRDLTEQEMGKIFELVATSSKTHEDQV